MSSGSTKAANNIPRTKTGWRSHKRLIQFVEYAFGGGVWFWSGYIVFAVCYSGLHWAWWPAKMLADLIGWTLNYLVQRYWAFANPVLKGQDSQVRLRYIILSAVNFVIDYAIIAALNSIGITPYIGFFVSAGFFTVWSYFWYRFWVFKPKARA